MKIKKFFKIILLFATIFLISCNHRSFFTEGEWVYISDNGETISLEFLKNRVNVNKYYYFSEYEIKNNKLYFIHYIELKNGHIDTTSNIYKVLIVNDSTVRLKNIFSGKYSNSNILRDTLTLNRKTINIKEYDIFMSQLAKIHNIGNMKILGDGSIFYNFNSYGNPYKSDIKIKGILDKSLGILPKKEEEKYSEWCNCMKKIYIWENLSLKVLIENDFRSNDTDDTYLNTRIWITEK